MNIRTCLILCITVLSLPCMAAFTVDVAFLSRDSKPGDDLVIRLPALRLVIRDEAGKQVKTCIDTTRSGAIKAANWTLHHATDATTQTYTLHDLETQPSSGELVTHLIISPSGEAAFDDMTKDGWRVTIPGTAATPALTLKTADGSVHVVESVDIAVPKMSEQNANLIKLYRPLERKFEAGGGDDGSVFGLTLAYNAPVRLTDDDQLLGWHAQFEGSFTPKPDEALSLYGRYEGEAGAFRTVRVGPNNWINGSLYLDLNTRFEGDQKVDNYNYTVGAGVWALIAVKPLWQLSHGLYWLTNFGQDGGMKDAPILTLYAGYDYVAASEREASAEPQDKNRARFRARYRTPLWRDVDLPLMPTVFDVDAVADFSAVLDFASGRFLPEVKASIEFMPKSLADQKLAFALSYVSGKISPTFVDEDAFLAGLRWKF